MDNRIPSILHPLLEDYASRLRTVLGDALTGIYLHGSFVLDAFDERSSDIDFVTVIERVLAPQEISAIGNIHRRLSLNRWGRRMDGIYAVRNDLALPDAPRFLHVHHGWLRRRMHPLPIAARLLLHEHGAVVTGPPARNHFAPVSPALLRDEMQFNLNTYWAGKAARPWLFLADATVDFAVTTLPRIIHTLEHGTIISKQQGLVLLDDRFPEWRDLSEDVCSRRGRRSVVPFGSPARARRTVAFIRSMIAHGNNLDTSSIQRPVTSSPSYIVS
jgi:hypothetical protein